MLSINFIEVFTVLFSCCDTFLSPHCFTCFTHQRFRSLWLDRIAELIQLIQLILSLGRGQWGAPHVLAVHEGACELLMSLNKGGERWRTLQRVATRDSFLHTAYFLACGKAYDTIGLAGHEPALGWRSTEADRGCGAKTQKVLSCLNAFLDTFARLSRGSN